MAARKLRFAFADPEPVSTESRKGKRRTRAEPLLSPARRSKTLPPVHANAGLTAALRKRLDALIKAMHEDVNRQIETAYKLSPPLLARDATTSTLVRDVMKRLGIKWEREFDKLAPFLAEHFSKAVQDRSDRALKSALRKAGFSVPFKMTAPMREVMDATIAQQVGLIRSIPQEYLQEVEGMVMRSVTKGGDLGTLTGQLRDRYDVSRNRAAFIARDQNAKATASMTRVRHLELGVEEAVWRHSGGGRKPRPDHVAFSAGHNGGPIFNVKEGALISGERIQPGELPNCRCVARAIIPGLSRQ